MNLKVTGCGTTVLIKDGDRILEVLEVFSYRDIRDNPQHWYDSKLNEIFKKYKKKYENLTKN